MATTSIKAGLLLRRHVRVQLELNEITFTEHKSLLDSIFVVHGSHEQTANVDRWVAAMARSLSGAK